MAIGDFVAIPVTGTYAGGLSCFRYQSGANEYIYSFRIRKGTGETHCITVTPYDNVPVSTCAFVRAGVTGGMTVGFIRLGLQTSSYYWVACLAWLSRGDGSLFLFGRNLTSSGALPTTLGTIYTPTIGGWPTYRCINITFPTIDYIVSFNIYRSERELSGFVAASLLPYFTLGGSVISPSLVPYSVATPAYNRSFYRFKLFSSGTGGVSRWIYFAIVNAKAAGGSFMSGISYGVAPEMEMAGPAYDYEQLLQTKVVQVDDGAYMHAEALQVETGTLYFVLLRNGKPGASDWIDATTSPSVAADRPAPRAAMFASAPVTLAGLNHGSAALAKTAASLSPTTTLDFTLGTLPVGLTYTRQGTSTDLVNTDAAARVFNQYAQDVPRFNSRGIMMECQFTNNYGLNTAPTVRTASLSANNRYECWVNAAAGGTITITNNTTLATVPPLPIVVTHGNPVAYDVITAGQALLTPTGTIYAVSHGPMNNMYGQNYVNYGTLVLAPTTGNVTRYQDKMTMPIGFAVKSYAISIYPRYSTPVLANDMPSLASPDGTTERLGFRVSALDEPQFRIQFPGSGSTYLLPGAAPTKEGGRWSGAFVRDDVDGKVGNRIRAQVGNADAWRSPDKLDIVATAGSFVSTPTGTTLVGELNAVYLWDRSLTDTELAWAAAPATTDLTRAIVTSRPRRGPGEARAVTVRADPVQVPPGGITNYMRNSVLAGTALANSIEIVTNGDFALNPLNAAQNTVQNGWQWSIGGGVSTVTWGSGAVTITGDGVNSANIDTSFPTIVGATYTVALLITSAVFVAVGTSKGGTQNLAATTLAVVSATVQFIATATTTWLRIWKNSGPSVVDNVSVVSAGRLPVNMHPGSAAGLWYQITGQGVEDGLSYFDLRFWGTSNSTGINLMLGTGNEAAAVLGQGWTNSCYLKLVGGTTTNFVGIRPAIWSYNSVSAILTTSPATAAYVPTNAVLSAQRVAVAWTTDAAGTAWVRPTLVFGVVNGVAHDFTIRIGGIQLQQGLVATSWVQSGSPNEITNSMLTGGTVGTPGTPPTGHALFTGGGLVRNVTGLGTVNGEPYVDYQFVGTASAQYAVWVANQLTLVPCAPGQTWTNSASFQVIAGNLTNINSFAIAIRSVNAISSTSFAPTSTMTRQTHTGVIPVGVGYVYATCSMDMAVGVPINVTIRQTMHQLEPSAVATAFKHYGQFAA